jgi:hypothetical protein
MRSIWVPSRSGTAGADSTVAARVVGGEAALAAAIGVEAVSAVTIRVHRTRREWSE